jgi:hypothetical protein
MKAAGDLVALCSLPTRVTLVLAGRCVSTVERTSATVRERSAYSRVVRSEGGVAVFEMLEGRVVAALLAVAVAVVLLTVVDEVLDADVDVVEEDTDAVVDLEVGTVVDEVADVDTDLGASVALSNDLEADPTIVSDAATVVDSTTDADVDFFFVQTTPRAGADACVDIVLLSFLIV